jgi:hypothetical protein
MTFNGQGDSLDDIDDVEDIDDDSDGGQGGAKKRRLALRSPTGTRKFPASLGGSGPVKKQRGGGASSASSMRSSGGKRGAGANSNSKRKRRIPWAAEEIDNLRNGVQEHGVGKWALILVRACGCGVDIVYRCCVCASSFCVVVDPQENYPFQSRSNVDLKDKWRNLNND